MLEMECMANALLNAQVLKVYIWLVIARLDVTAVANYVAKTISRSLFDVRALS